MSVRVLLMSVAVASGSAFCVSPKPHLPARRSLPRRPRTMPPQCARIGGRCVDTRIVETKVDPHSNSLATRPWLLALASRSLLHSFHVPTPPLDGLQEELRRRLQKTTVALEEANAALEELRGPYRLALAYREGLAVTVIAAAAVGATLWLCVLIARAHLLGYIYVLLCYVIVPWTVLRCLTARSLDADSVSWCVLVLVCVCRGYFTVPM